MLLELEEFEGCCCRKLEHSAHTQTSASQSCQDPRQDTLDSWSSRTWNQYSGSPSAERVHHDQKQDYFLRKRTHTHSHSLTLTHTLTQTFTYTHTYTPHNCTPFNNCLLEISLKTLGVNPRRLDPELPKIVRACVRDPNRARACV